MNLVNINSIFAANGCRKIYAKQLAPNDNSKNQIYLGGSFEILNIFPISSIETEPAGDWERERFKAGLNFSWITEEGQISLAPNAQLILYPKYPEVRFSGFLKGCQHPPSDLMTQRLAGRLLFLSVAGDGRILGYVAAPDSAIANEFNLLHTDALGVFQIMDLPEITNNRQRLIAELTRISALEWITSKRLDKHNHILPCTSPNCGGYTLEAELGITPNGYSEPDYLGWELKQFSVRNFSRLNSAIITLMTPEPTAGLYKEEGVEAFVHRYGYDDLRGRQNRRNFGGIHITGKRHPRTGLTMQLIGFDTGAGKIRNADGQIALIDGKDNMAAAWSFSSLMIHWSRKHSQACYIPSMSQDGPERKYRYGNSVILG
ncbi:MAG TPA: MvaI/BcnI family restriction endonuclease, partial [Puia sp.]|nr:MvaI/BcnI family restriction endonuclease [Puia sp.]